MRIEPQRILAVLVATGALACGGPDGEAAAQVDGGAIDGGTVNRTEDRPACLDATPFRQALFGDLHVHTSFSFDAAAISTGASPADAYRYARGEAIPFWPIGADGTAQGSIAIDRPLDFVAVTDHGEFLGERRLCSDPESSRYNSEFCTTARSDQRLGMQMLGAVITTETPERVGEVCGEDGALCLEWAMDPWHAIVEDAEAAYDRTQECTFTSFVGYEYTGTPGVSNYHRNVIFRGSEVPDLPVSYIDAPSDSELWRQLDQVCGEGSARPDCDYLTIPHNSNLANGRMAPYRGLDRSLETRQAYAQKRLEREPLIEIFQHKGGSECMNGLSSVFAEPDELCDVEAVRVLGRAETVQSLLQGETTLVTEECPEGEVGTQGMLGAGCVDGTDFVRSALVVGLEEEREIGLDPVKLGIIASTDTHTATPGAVAEEDWRGAVTGEATPQERLQPGFLTSGIDGNAGGLAGVWAVENSRDAIFDAMERREVFGTSGPRIRPRFFGGWNYAENLCDNVDLLEEAYAGGVPMGGDLTRAEGSQTPTFLAHAVRDPAENAGQLQQLQLVKGWVEADGARHTRVIPIAGSPDNGASVDRETGERSGDGHDSLCSVYRDEDFDPGLHAWYYLRVVENPSLRWSWHDCRRLAREERPAVCSDGSYPETIHEMAWTSPIWYQPEPGAE